MIDDPPLLKIRRRFKRPTPEQVAALTGIPTGYLVDCMDGRGALDYRIKPIDEATADFCGVALTCHAGPADNLAAMAALDVAEAGDVIIAATDGFMETAVIGDLVLAMARNRGVVGFVTDGAVRDLTGLRPIGLPCFAAGVTPNSPARNGPGTVGLPITLGGSAIAPGDVVVGDIDGVVVVPQDLLRQVLDRLPAIREAEAGMEAKVKDGLEVPDFIREVLASGRVQELD